METIFVGYYWEIWNLDRLWKSQVFPRTPQVEWVTSKMVSKATRLWLHIITYSEKDKHQSRCVIKKRPSEYQGR